MLTEFFKTKTGKIVWPLLMVVAIIGIWQNGYAFGKWLYETHHK